MSPYILINEGHCVAGKISTMKAFQVTKQVVLNVFQCHKIIHIALCSDGSVYLQVVFCITLEYIVLALFQQNLTLGGT